MNPDSLDLGVSVDGVGAHLAAPAAGLEAAPGGGGVGDGEHVDEDGAGADVGGQAVGGGEVARPERGGQAEVAVVGAGSEFFGVVVGQDGQDGPEDLFAGDGHVVGDATEDGGAVEVAVGEGAVGAFASGEQLGAFLLAGADVGVNLGEVLQGGEGADLGLGVQAGTQVKGGGGVRELLGELVGAAAVDVEAGVGGADLAAVEEGAL